MQRCGGLGELSEIGPSIHTYNRDWLHLNSFNKYFFLTSSFSSRPINIRRECFSFSFFLLTSSTGVKLAVFNIKIGQGGRAIHSHFTSLMRVLILTPYSKFAQSIHPSIDRYIYIITYTYINLFRPVERRRAACLMAPHK